SCVGEMSAVYKDDQDDWMTVCLKYLLFVFNVLFWVSSTSKSDYLSLLASSTFAVSAYILILAGALVMVTGFLGCCAVIREQRSCLSTLSEELKQHLNQTMTENYAQPGKEAITLAVDRLQQDFKCCGSNNSFDWLHSVYVTSAESERRVVPDSCCKTITTLCGCRDHPSNIYKTEVGVTIGKSSFYSTLEQFLADHLLIIGAVGIGVACLQVGPPTLTSGFINRK
ncbi:unnamed protein product, partial [Coregonus sp. 'balchen']